MIHKEALRPRKHSSDPVQEKLRADKSSWNDQASHFIAQLNAFKPKMIAFKRGLNGKGDPRAGIPASDIKNPLPGEVSSYLSLISNEFHALTSSFDQLVSEVSGVISEQAQYSNSRKKGKTASLDFSEEELVALASNPFSRFWAQMIGKFDTSAANVQRLSMLKKAAQINASLKDFEEMSLVKGTKNIELLEKAYASLRGKFDSLVKDVTLYATSLNREKLNDPSTSKKETEEEVPVKEKPKSPAKNDEEDIERRELPAAPAFITALKVQDVLLELKELYEVFPKQSVKDNIVFGQRFFKEDPESKKFIRNILYKRYYKDLTDFRKTLEKDLNEKIPASANLEDLLKIKEDGVVGGDIKNKTAGPIQRMLGRTNHYWRNDETTSARIHIADAADLARTENRKLMDLLEKKNPSPESLTGHIAKINEHFKQMYAGIQSLKLDRLSGDVSSKDKMTTQVRDRMERLDLRKLFLGM